MRIYLVIVFLFLFFNVHAQKETSNWFLHNNRVSITPDGVSNISPSGISQNFNPTAGSTSISDSAGNLLFASDGKTIIDKNFSVMPALTGIDMKGSSKVLAVKIPNSIQYYVFYSIKNSYPANTTWTLKYALVDFSLNSGLGDVISYDQIIGNDLSEGFTLVQGENTEDVWLVTHKHGTTNFLSYKITYSGLSNTPVSSAAGTVETTTNYIFKDLKASHDGKMIAGLAYRVYTNIFSAAYSFLEVFNFNVVTGGITHKIRTLRTYAHFHTYFSIEFSPDNRLVYCGYVSRSTGLQACDFSSSRVIQYNLCYLDSTSFTKNSMMVADKFVPCAPSSSWGRIQLGADKKIYMPFSGTTISSINYPNRIGSSCNYQHNTHQVLSNNFGTIATPTFHHKKLEKAVKNNIVYSGSCFPNPITFRITNDTITNIVWDFGDPASSTNSSTLVTPQHTFSNYGFYTITANLYNTSGAFIEKITELIEIKDQSKRLLHDTLQILLFVREVTLSLN